MLYFGDLRGCRELVSSGLNYKTFESVFKVQDLLRKH